nr:ORF228 [Mycoplasmopsis fermentans]
MEYILKGGKWMSLVNKDNLLIKEENLKPKKIVFPLIGSIINVQAFKFNGELYRQWNGVKVLRNTPQHYVLFMYKTKVAETDKKGWVYREYVLWFMPKNSMYNALILLKPKSNYVYVNLASKPYYEDNTIKFVDFDLDVKSYPKKDFTIVDKEEFRYNSRRLKYPKKLINMIYDNLEEIVNKHNNGEYFFNPDVIDYYINQAKKDKSIYRDFRVKKASSYSFKWRNKNK